MALEPKDLEQIERLIYKNADDIAVSFARSFERLEDEISASESRVQASLTRLIRPYGENRFEEPEGGD